MPVLKYKDPETGEVKKIGSPEVDAYSKGEVNAKLSVHTEDKNNPHGVTAEQIGAAPAYTYGTSDLTAGESALETGKLYLVYE
jgi:hypothetical protein